jgi:GalNAc5-diNAcBac-PP-undecaprenol beta-1,3-glucosyltransferase
MTTATVLVPTHNHGRLLSYSIASALAQTISSLEIFIVGDGVDDATRASAQELAASDARVRFFDRPKGQRHGEATRHAVLQEAAGTIVCYLSDDDLWLPHHVETMVTALRDADFAHAVPLYVEADGRIQVHPGDLDVPSVQARMTGRFNFIPLSAAAHTLTFYRRLPKGWTPAPPDLPTDLHMWQQILAVNGCRAVATERTTLVNFPALLRRDWSIEQREAELSRWSDRLQSGTFEADLATAGLRRVMRSFVDAEQSAHLAAEQAEAARAMLAEARETERATLWNRIRSLQNDLSTAVNRTASRESEHAAERARLQADIATLGDELAAATERSAVLETERQAERAALQHEIVTLRAVVATAGERAVEAQREREELREHIAELRTTLAATETRATEAQRTLGAMERTITWRMRTGLLAWRPLAAIWANLRGFRKRSGS